jgi:hypothetical protein
MPRNGQLRERSDDGLSLVISIRASFRFRIAENETWDTSVVLVGSFTSARELSDDDAQFFAASSALYVLWPYVRTELDQLARFAGVTIPQLPLIVRPSLTTLPRPPERP